MIRLAVALAAPVLAAAVVPDDVPSGPVRHDGSTAWRSPQMIASVATLVSPPFLGGDMEGATTHYDATRAIVRDRPRNVAWPAFPSLDAGDVEDACDRMIAAATAAHAAGGYGSRGAYPLRADAPVLRDAMEFVALRELVALREPSYPLTRWGYAFASLLRRRAALAAASADNRESAYYLGSIWRDVVRLAILLDDQGSPIGGERWDGGVVESLLVGVDDASARLGDVVVWVGQRVVGVAGAATWGVISSPVGVVILLGGLWLTSRRS